jgi:PDGLE domain
MSTSTTPAPTTRRSRLWGFIGLGLVVALLLAGLVSYYASSSPDGLEKVAADKGISAQERRHHLADSPLGDYGVHGVNDARLSGGLAGVIGVGVTLALGGGLFWLVRRRAG